MSDDLDAALRGLRDDLHAEIPLPDLTRIAGRARQRRTVRRTQIGAVAAVVMVSVAVPMLRSMPTDQPSSPPPAIRSAPYTVDFADPEHGYALRKECTTGRHARCSVGMLVSADGGRTWESRDLPKGDSSSGDGTLDVLGPDQLSFLRYTIGRTQHFMSDDAGRTWRQLGTAGPPATGAPSAIPPGGKLFTMCRGPSTDNRCELGFGVWEPDTERVAPLLTQPPLVNPKGGTVATAGGRFWTVGRDRVTGMWAVSVTSDAGATWATTPLDLPGEPEPEPNVAWAVVEHGGVMYTTVEGTLAEGGPPGLLAVFRSTDGGVSWTRTWHAEQVDRLWAIQGSTIATADGLLVVNSMTEGTFESTDGGATFTLAERQLPPWPIRWTRGGYLAMGPGNRYEISSDGIDWLSFQLP